MISPQTLAKLRAFDTPTICNVIELFDARPRHTGFMNARIVAAFPEMPPRVGFAATATFRASAPPRGDAYSSLDKQVERFAELSGAAVVVFQDLDSPCVAATFGEIMCTTYQAFGAVGLITSGAGRDLDQVRKIGFPVFTNGTICSHGYSNIPQIHIPVHVGGIAIYPDDLLHADCNGVTTIPKEIAAEIADIGDEYVAAEILIIDAMRESPGNLKLLRERQAESKNQMAKLRARVARTR
ncbi:MAG: RraA family protein [Chloroflexi bacterium]|nr:RraA family protein [Chloroflexota bacterium]